MFVTSEPQLKVGKNVRRSVSEPPHEVGEKHIEVQNRLRRAPRSTGERERNLRYDSSGSTLIIAITTGDIRYQVLHALQIVTDAGGLDLACLPGGRFMVVVVVECRGDWGWGPGSC